VLGDDHSDTLKSMNSLAILYWSQGRYDEAEPLLLETLETKKRVLGDDHPDTLDAMHSLAILYQRQGRFDEAEPLALETLKIRRRVLGDHHRGTSISMYNLACLEIDRGNNAAAMDWLRQAVEAGFGLADHMSQDSDLEPLHGPEFDALVERVRRNAEAQRAE
jgi:tetratricopeptide (TPR) repeat protein